MTTLALPGHSRSFWIETAPYPRWPRLESDLDVDVAILGAGITGITAGALLARAGLRVAVLEAREVAQGVSGHTTAHLTSAIDTRFATLEKDFGKDGAALAASASAAAIDRIARFVDELGIACRFRRLPGWLFTEGEDDLEDLHREYEAAKAAGLPVTMSRDVPLPFATAAGIRFEEQAEFHVREYLLPLCGEILAKGGVIHEDTRAVDVEDGDPCRVVTDHGPVVRAKYVLMATHAPLQRLRFQTNLSHYRSYVLGLRTREPALGGIFWDTADPYHYLRSDVESGLLIVGGEDHKTGTDEHTKARFESLRDYASERFGVTEIGFHWSGQVIETSDGLPFLGRSSSGSNILVGTGYSGNGMTFGTLAGMLAADLVTGVDNRWAKLFDPSRVKPLASAASFVKENAEVAAHFVGDWVRPADASNVADVAPGEGKIVRVGAKRVAVYRAPTGELACVSSVCPHLGCHVHFNDAEKTWDCPCHGSRFDTKGAVLDGPATSGLAPVDLDAAH